MNENAPGNNQMKSPTIQKDLTWACAAEVTNVILNDIKDNIFSLMVDECRDISVKEQMGVVLRYAIDELFAKHKLSLSRLRGQGYDEASNMRVAKSNRIVSDFFQYVTMIVNIIVLENVYDDGTHDDNSGIATNLIDKMESYEFVFVMHLMKYLLGITNELSLALQQKDQNIVLAVLDMMVQEMNNRFSESSTELLHLAELYPEDFSLTDRVILEVQLETYIQNARGEFSMIEDLRSLAKKIVETGKNIIFSLVYRLIELALVLPVATASVERVFSAMEIIKTNLCNMMGMSG
ncbi:uncharacterized protein LOC122044278 [Zingiber officinale]|uniref:uncharacterized protein LOC122044278 n=1 Tax=Zingiber officinale TaxID=94328 RepID=UPI001C4B9A41|nr:uncharacterized protein LOC122044278 [Zingiber officinale]